MLECTSIARRECKKSLLLHGEERFLIGHALVINVEHGIASGFHLPAMVKIRLGSVSYKGATNIPRDPSA
jgi:hypothetical protein